MKGTLKVHEGSGAIKNTAVKVKVQIKFLYTRKDAKVQNLYFSTKCIKKGHYLNNTKIDKYAKIKTDRQTE